jgi:O-antigen ligase
MESRLATSIRVILALVMVAPLIVMADPLPSTFFPFIVGKALWARTLTEIAFGLWIILILRDSYYRIPKSWLLPVFGVYVLIALMATAFGVSPTRSMWSTFERMQGWVDLVHWFTFILILVSTHKTWSHWRGLLNFNIGVSVVMGLLGLSQFYDAGVFRYLQSTTRLDITLGNPTYVGGYMMVNVFIAAAFLARSFMGRPEVEAGTRSTERRKRRRARRQDADSETISSVYFWRAFWIGAILLDFVIFYLTGTRGAMFGLAVGLTAFGVGYSLWGSSRKVRLATMGTTAFVAVLIVLVGVILVARAGGDGGGVNDSKGMFERVLNTGLRDNSLEGRIDSAQIGIDGFLARPILGWGPENFTIAYDRHVPPKVVAVAVTSFDQAHNKLIEELTTKGILGFLGYMALWVYMAVIFVRKVRFLERDEKVFTLLIGAALIGYFAQNLFLFDTPGTVPQFYILLGFTVFVDSLVLREGEPESDRVMAEVDTSGPRGPLVPSLTGEMAVGSAIVTVAVMTFATIYLLNILPYAASSEVLPVLNTNLTWEQRFEAFDNSVNAFPPLGNYPRIVLFNEINRHWDTLTDDQVVAALQTAETQGTKGTIAEPEEWRIYNAMAGVFQRVANSDPIFMTKARQLVDRSVELAPSRIEVQRLLIRQHIIEDDYQGSLRVIDEYLKETPEAVPHFEGIRADVQQVIEQRASEGQDAS